MGGQKQQTPGPDEGLKIHPVAEDDEAEGHAMCPKRASEAPEPEEGIRVHPVTGDDDIEGHRRNFH